MSKSSALPIVVIGAGSTGSSVAYHLAKMNERVLIIDSGQPASGTTSKSTAVVRTHYSNEIVAKMAVYSLQVLRDFGGIGNSGFVNSGMLFLGTTSLARKMREVESMLSGLGVKSEVMDESAASKRFPDIDVSGFESIHFEPESGYADPVATANSYLGKARDAYGAETIFGTEVRKLDLDPVGRVEAVLLSDGRKIHCSKVVLCTNVWTNKLLYNTKQGSSLPIWAAPHPVIVMKRPARYEGVRPIVADFKSKAYLRPEGKSFLFVGSLDPAIDAQKVDPDTCPSDVSFEHQSFFAEFASKRIPSMSEGLLHSSYIGMYDMSPDSHPIIDELSEIGLSGVFCCVGLSGHGFKLSPAFGLMVAEMVTEKKNQTFDRTHFSLSRFAKGKLLQSKYAEVGTIA